MLDAMKSVAMAGSAVLSYPQGVESWGITFDPAVVYTGSQLEQIASYCASNKLTLSAQFSALGVV